MNKLTKEEQAVYDKAIQTYPKPTLYIGDKDHHSALRVNLMGWVLGLISLFLILLVPCGSLILVLAALKYLMGW